MMKKNKQFAPAIALALTAGGMPAVQAQTAADFQDAEYYASGGLDIINAADAYALGYTGKGITLGISDEPVNFSNPEFNLKKNSGRVNTTNMKGYAPGIYIWSGLDHGTHVAGIAAADRNGIGMQGVAYEADIASAAAGVDYKAGSFRNRNDYYAYYLKHPEIKVINNSWGSGFYMDLDKSPYSAYYNYVMRNITPQMLPAVEQGKLLVMAAGNFGHTTPLVNGLFGQCASALHNNQLTVTALDAYNTRSGNTITANKTDSNVMAFFSDLAKYAEDNTLAAPGYLIQSAAAAYAETGEIDRQDSGTSMAAPFVSGTGALVQQAFPYMSGKQIGDVLLSTADSSITYPRGIVMQAESDSLDDGSTMYSINFFVVDSKLQSLTPAEILARGDAYMNAYDTDSLTYAYKKMYQRAKAAGNINVYYDVSWQELIGQGAVDAGAAVRGPGALNARRLLASDISSSYTLSGTTTSQALYTIDTQGYDSTWSNDIKEIKAGYIASDSTEADLLARYNYYNRNWLSYTGTDRNEAKIRTKEMMDLYNQRVKDSGLAGLSVGLYKTGLGTLTLSGTNTYVGSSIAAGGTLAIDGSVAGDAWSVKDTSAGTTGTISGVGIIKGNLYNHGIAYPSQAGKLTVNGALTSDGAIGLATAADGQSSHQLMIAGAANINGSTLQRVNGSAYLPDKNYGFLSAGSITGSLMNTVGSAFSGLLSIKNLAVSNTSGAVTLGLANNAGNLSPNQQWTYDSLPNLLANTQGDSTKQTQLGLLLGASPEEAAAGLASAARSSAADAAAMAMSSLTAMNAIGARTMYLSTAASFQGSASPARSDDTVTTQSNIIPVDLGPTTSGWLKFSKSWEQLGDNSTNGHGFATSFGFDRSVGHDWRLGGFFSYGDNSFASTSSTLTNKDYRLGIYGIREKGPRQTFLYFDLGRQNNDSKRWITAGASYLADSSYKSKTIELGGRYTYDTDYGKAQSWHRKPYGELQVVRYNQDSYSESGAGIWNQSVGSGSSTYSAATVGLGLEKKMKNEEIEVHLGYKRVLSGSDPTYPVHWLDGSDPTYPVHWLDGSDNGYELRGSGLDKNLLVFGIHAEQNQESGWRLSGDVELEKGHSQRNLQASVMLKKNW